MHGVIIPGWWLSPAWSKLTAKYSGQLYNDCKTFLLPSEFTVRSSNQLAATELYRIQNYIQSKKLTLAHWKIARFAVKTRMNVNM